MVSCSESSFHAHQSGSLTSNDIPHNGEQARSTLRLVRDLRLAVLKAVNTAELPFKTVPLELKEVGMWVQPHSTVSQNVSQVCITVHVPEITSCEPKLWVYRNSICDVLATHLRKVLGAMATEQISLRPTVAINILTEQSSCATLDAQGKQITS